VSLISKPSTPVRDRPQKVGAMRRVLSAEQNELVFLGGSSVVPRGYIGKNDPQSCDKLSINTSILSGTAGWTRTTDLLIHSQAL
jgi:hypothetical protein